MTSDMKITMRDGGTELVVVVGTVVVVEVVDVVLVVEDVVVVDVVVDVESTVLEGAVVVVEGSVVVEEEDEDDALVDVVAGMVDDVVVGAAVAGVTGGACVVDEADAWFTGSDDTEYPFGQRAVVFQIICRVEVLVQMASVLRDVFCDAGDVPCGHGPDAL